MLDEVSETLRDLRAAGVDVVTIGQYLRPSPKHAAVARYVEPAQFARWEAEALSLGFAYAASGPLVRSSYKAAEVFVRSMLRPGDPAAAAELLASRLDEARTAAARVASASVPGTTSELAAQAAVTVLRDAAAGAGLLPANALVRR